MSSKFKVNDVVIAFDPSFSAIHEHGPVMGLIKEHFNNGLSKGWTVEVPIDDETIEVYYKDHELTKIGEL